VVVIMAFRTMNSTIQRRLSRPEAGRILRVLRGIGVVVTAALADLLEVTENDLREPLSAEATDTRRQLAMFARRRVVA